MSYHCRHKLIKDLIARWWKQWRHKLTLTVVVKERTRWLKESAVWSLRGVEISQTNQLKAVSNSV